jgi:hypothetical protein
MPDPSHGGRSTTASSLNLPFLILAAVCSGIGVFLMSYWMITQDLLYFAGGVVLAGAGCLMLFHPGTGAESG